MKLQLRTLHFDILRWLKSVGAKGATPREIADALSLPIPVVHSRVHEMKQLKLVKETGEQRGVYKSSVLVAAEVPSCQ